MRLAALFLLLVAARDGAPRYRPFRRLQVTNVDGVKLDFGQPAPVINTVSNIAAIADATSASPIVLSAGPEYPQLALKADDGGLGREGEGVVVKVIPAEEKSCDGNTVSLAPSPLDGAADPSSATTSLNTFEKVTFPLGGLFKLCYRKVAGGPYDVLPLVLDIRGATHSSRNFWCIWMKDTAIETGVGLCRGVVNGLGTPTEGTWRLILQKMDAGVCGAQDTQPFYNKLSEVTVTEDGEIHNFGKRNENTPITMYRICYCPGFDADGGAGTNNVEAICDSSAKEDFVQEVGRIVMMFGEVMLIDKVSADERTVSVYPSLPFTIKFTCGDGEGGCSGGSGPRYKIVKNLEMNDRNYFDKEAGCRSMPQIDEHLSPQNCAGAADCVDERDDVPVSPKNPTFDAVQIDGMIMNTVTIPQYYDACYCDDQCFSNKNWFKVFDLSVLPMRVDFMLTEADAWDALGYDSIPTNIRRLSRRERRLAGVEDAVAVNTPGYVAISGRDGSWSLEGNKKREMKILPDNDGLTTRDSCLEQSQSTLYVSGHTCTLTSDCDSPSYSKKDGHIYGEIKDGADKKGNIRIRQSGFAAVCYCDVVCNEAKNWIVAGRLLVAGPKSDENWVFSTNVAFQMKVHGVELADTNYAMIIKGTDTCTEASQSTVVFGPLERASLNGGRPDSNAINAIIHDEGGRGIRINFDQPHSMVDGDLISLQKIQSQSTAPMDEYEERMLNTAHKVELICDLIIEGEPCYSIAVPVYFLGAFPSLFINEATWTQSNIETFKDIRATKSGNYKVCWSQSSRDSDLEFVGTAGLLVIIPPVVMRDAKLALTSIEPGAKSPVILLFETGDSGRYSEAEGPMQLKIVFQNAAYLAPVDRSLAEATVDEDYDTFEERSQKVCGQYILELWSDDADGFPHPEGCYLRIDTTDTSENSIDLWELYIVFAPKNGLRREQQYEVVLNAQLGPLLSPESPDDGAVHIWSMDDVYYRPFDAIELGKAFADKSVATLVRNEEETDPAFLSGTGFKIVQPDNPNLQSGGRQEMGYRCSSRAPRSCGICYSEEMCGNLDPTVKMCITPIDPQCSSQSLDEAALQFTITAEAGMLIREKNIIRVFLMPLTQWWIKERCQATCIAHPGTSCGGELTQEPQCEVESVIGGLVIQKSEYHVNTLKITLPDDMTQITATTSHRIKVDSLIVPEGGFLPQTIPAELQKADGEKPHFWDTSQLATSGLQLYMQPKTVVASLVTTPGDGNAAAFRGDKDNLLYLKLVAGTTWHSSGSEGVHVKIKLPPGYKCKSQGVSMEVPAKLNVFGTRAPSGRGLLATREAEGLWTSEEGEQDWMCILKFEQNAIWYAKSSVFTAVVVDNPDTAFAQFKEDNKWEVDMYASGNGWEVPDMTLISAEGLPYLAKKFSGTGDLSGAVSVLGKLNNELIVPTNFAFSAKNDLMVFFRTEQEVGLKTDILSQIWVDAPNGFDYGRYCMVQHLPNEYYVPEPEIPTARIPTGDLIECKGKIRNPEHTGYTRAVIATEGRLLGNSQYGFYLRITNAGFFNREMTDDWRIFTYTQRKEAVDGSFATVKWNAQEAHGSFKSWGPYLRKLEPENFQVTIPDLRPTGELATDIVVFPVMVTLPTDRNVRILAPLGYRWSFSQSEFIYRSINSGAPPEEAMEGADRDFPLSLIPTNPITEPFNELAIEYLAESFLPGFKYGFKTKIRIPPISPSAAPNAFTIELGYDERYSEDRTEACVKPAQLVRALINGAITYRTNIRSMRNVITFSVQVITDIVRDGGLVFSGPPEFEFVGPPTGGSHRLLATNNGRPCSPKAGYGSRELPYDSACRSYVEVGSLVPSIVLTAGPSGIPAAMYTLSFDALNPGSLRAAGREGAWAVHCYEVVSEHTMLDAPTSIQSFRVNQEMLYAAIVPAVMKPCKFADPNDPEQTLLLLPEEQCGVKDWQYHRSGKSDHPGYPSTVVIEFMLNENPAPGPLTMLLHAPRGFEFANECIFEQRPSHVFWADNPTTDVPTGFTDEWTLWGTNFGQLVSCRGKDARAEVILGPGLSGMQSYVFRISVLRNPIETPWEYNYWLLEVGGETSLKMEGFLMWAFNSTRVDPHDVAMSARNNKVPQPVNIYFIPYNEIKAGGRLVVQAPSGFRIETECTASITPIPLTADALPIDAPDVKCMGDINPSNNGQVILIVDEEDEVKTAKNVLLSKYLYKLTIGVSNPESTSVARDWLLASYHSMELSSLADKSYIPGYTVTYRVYIFGYDTPTTVSGTRPVLLKIRMGFPQKVVAGDSIVLDTPFGFVLNEEGRGDCKAYRHLTGYLKRTIPNCGANRMTWALTDEMLPANSEVTVQFASVNPPKTPASNFFEIKHIRHEEVYASRIIDGYPILPQLQKVAVAFGLPVRQAVGSSTTVDIIFEAESAASHVSVKGRVDYEFFDMSEVTTLEGLEVHTAAETEAIIGLAIQRHKMTNVILKNVRNPKISGVSIWDLTTFYGGVEDHHRLDRKLDTTGPTILGRITVKPSSAVRPNAYGTEFSTANFNIKSSVTLKAGDILLLTRPDGFLFYDKTMMVKRFMSVGKHGIMPGTGERVYKMLLNGPLEKDTEAAFSVEVSIPEEDFAGDPSWTIAADSAATDDSPSMPLATNDNLFTGFLLVGRIQFFVIPQMKTPGALGYMELTFQLTQQINAIEQVKVQLTAPRGFSFAASCLGQLSMEFLQCTGQGNQLVLSSAAKHILKGEHKVVLLGSNGPETPEFNFWKLSAFRDEETQYINFSEWSGYTLQAMNVELKGNNQISGKATLFITFTSGKNAERRAQLIVSPPKRKGYTLSCDLVYRIGLPKEPDCYTTGMADQDLTLTVSNSTIVEGITYTFGIGVLNPGEPIPPDDNMWGLTLKDRSGSVVDSNRNIEGLPLKMFPAEVLGHSNRPGLAWSDAMPGKMSRVRIEIVLKEDVEPRTLGEVLIISPEGVMFSDPGQAVVQPDGKFPLLATAPFTAAGNEFRVMLDASRGIDAGMYGVVFYVQNPTRLPNDNTWLVALIYHGELLFTSVLPGYVFGEPSPYAVSGGTNIRDASSAASVQSVLGFLCALVFFQY